MAETITATVTLQFNVPEGLNPEVQRERIREDIGRLYDADGTTGVECTGFELGAVKRPPTSRVHFICAGCGSPDVLTDAYGEWDAKAGVWVLHSIYDEKTCETCGSGIGLIEVDEATELEIQAFAMITDAGGARQAQPGEILAFYDVMVTTHQADAGDIHTLCEMDDLTREGVEKAVAVLQKSYPLAPVTYHFREVAQ